MRDALVAFLVGALAVAAGPAPARAAARPGRDGAAPGLPRLNITAAYVSGISSGSYMTSQLQVAYSSVFRGAGTFAAGPYYCGNGDILQLATQCGTDLTGLDVAELENTATRWAAAGRIDPLGNLADARVYAYHGTLDPLVSRHVSDAGVEFYRHFGADVRYHTSDNAGHGWPSPLGILPCGLTVYPFLINCGNDPEGEMLTHWLGHINPANRGPLASEVTRYDQDRYVPGGSAQWYSMAADGLAYIPPACAAGRPCTLVVALHGCASDTTFAGEMFPEHSYLDNYADTNDLVVLYPQTSISLLRGNPLGCWDWWGFTGSDFATRSGPQMQAIVNMVHALGVR
ncbi:poly(3-hydroxybutyrate) depolymerase [Krasilnikovia sp. MM14-A1004]|uniref:extracellular catalytic domain type 2 short-chain-length polyhydroxyalkanoate depolymerase n=1 Tax=Krasilnikovia sp. MM14-A1004 TaxID=3373541 RepID=UPI00399D3E4D